MGVKRREKDFSDEHSLTREGPGQEKRNEEVEKETPLVARNLVYLPFGKECSDSGMGVERRVFFYHPDG